jgi:hypothetical protein
MWDISFCSKKECKNRECLRNQKNYNFKMAGNHPISISNFSKCEHWKEDEK